MNRQNSSGPDIIYRQSWPTRIWHWVNAVCLFFLLLSGLQIFNAHPALYFGEQSTFDAPALSLTAYRGEGGSIRGETQIGAFRLDTTGVLGASADLNGNVAPRGFPSWLTIPSYQDLATGRVWHFFFAWLLVISGAVYLVVGLVNGHFVRDLAPSGKELRGIGRSIAEHARLHFRHDGRYNVLQKLSYIGVIFVLLPLMVATGLTMSPAIDSWAPWLLDLFGGRQTARTLHFIGMALLVLFFIVHIVMVIAAGPVNELRSIITGRYRTDSESKEVSP
ncbi:MAG: cytochrome b/b6 domain-containing protein [Propylenella sp.]